MQYLIDQRARVSWEDWFKDLETCESRSTPSVQQRLEWGRVRIGCGPAVAVWPYIQALLQWSRGLGVSSPPILGAKGLLMTCCSLEHRLTEAGERTDVSGA